MLREERAGLSVYRFASLPPDRLQAFVTTRVGGHSPPPYASLNMSFSSGDERANVIANRALACATWGLTLERSVWGFQVHADRVAAVGAGDAGRGKHGGDGIPGTDALVTAEVGLALGIVAADCVPIVLYDPLRHVAGLVHAGWRGTVARVACKAVDVMCSRHGSRAQDLLAGIGPSIGPQDYEVGPEVVAAAAGGLGEELAARVLVPTASGHARMDLWQANASALEQAGVPREQIEIAGISTATNLDELYSHRAEGPTGRFAALVCLCT